MTSFDDRGDRQLTLTLPLADAPSPSRPADERYARNSQAGKSLAIRAICKLLLSFLGHNRR
jgi:hypothetical protein